MEPYITIIEAVFQILVSSLSRDNYKVFHVIPESLGSKFIQQKEHLPKHQACTNLGQRELGVIKTMFLLS